MAGPVLVLLFAVLLGLVFLHASVDQFAAGLACLTIVLVLAIVSLLRPEATVRLLAIVTEPVRAAPAFACSAHIRPTQTAVAPLRL